MAEAKKPRLKRLKRAVPNELPGFQMTERDVEIMRTIASYQAVTSDQIRLLLFEGKQRSTQCDLRLRLLFQHGYLERRSQTILYEKNKPLVYLLTRKGTQYLATIEDDEHPENEWRPKFNELSQYHLQHLLQVNHVRSAIERACDLNNYELAWLNEHTIRQRKLYDRFRVQDALGATQTTTLIPDGFFTLDTPQLWLSCFLEVDRGTESLKTVAHKLNKYLAYFATNTYKERYGVQDEQGNEIYPCVLTITTIPKRVEHLKAIAQEVGASNIFLFAQLTNVTPESVFSQPIWQTVNSNTPICLIE